MDLSKIVEGYRAMFETPIGLVFAFLIGSVVGSFLNVVIVRLPKGESVVRPRSHCPRCKDSIPWYLNIPILSWLALRGRCRACKLPISPRYPMVELLTGVLFLAAVSTFGSTLAAVTAAIYSAALVVITFIDIDLWIIPDEISIYGMPVGFVLRPLAFGAPWWDGILGALIGAAALALIRWGHMLARRLITGEWTEGMGLGDIKLIAFIGAFVGVKGLLPAVLVASTTGSIIGIMLLIVRLARGEHKQPPEDEKKEAPAPEEKIEAKGEGEEEDEEEDDWEPHWTAVQFGPFLALGGMGEMFFGPWLMRWFHALIDRFVERVAG